MQRTVTNSFGTFRYEPTPFESLLDELAREFRITLSDSAPVPYFRSWLNRLREREASASDMEKDLDLKHYIGLDMQSLNWQRNYDADPSITYAKRPNELLLRELADTGKSISECVELLYTDPRIGYEFATIRKGDRYTFLELEPEGRKLVSFPGQETPEALWILDPEFWFERKIKPISH